MRLILNHILKALMDFYLRRATAVLEILNRELQQLYKFQMLQIKLSSVHYYDSIYDYIARLQST